MIATPDQLLDRIAVAVRGNLPPGISPAYLDGFLSRHRRTLVGVLQRELRARRTSFRGRHPPRPAHRRTA